MALIDDTIHTEKQRNDLLHSFNKLRLLKKIKLYKKKKIWGVICFHALEIYLKNSSKLVYHYANIISIQLLWTINYWLFIQPFLSLPKSSYTTSFVPAHHHLTLTWDGEQMVLGMTRSISQRLGISIHPKI